MIEHKIYSLTLTTYLHGVFVINIKKILAELQDELFHLFDERSVELTSEFSNCAVPDCTITELPFCADVICIIGCASICAVCDCTNRS